MPQEHATKIRIKEKATRLFNVKGLRSTSIDDIIRAAEIKKGAFYHHFIDKNQLYLEVIADAEKSFSEFLDDSLMKTEAPDRALSLFLQKAYSYHLETGFTGGCFFGNIAVEMADESPLLAARISEVFSMWQRRLKKIIIAGQKEGTFKKSDSAASLSQFVIMTIEGGIMLSRLTKKNSPMLNAVKQIKKRIFTGQG